MTYIARVISIFAFLLGSVAHAQPFGERWRYAERTEFKTNIAWIYGSLDGQLGEIGVDCDGDGLFVYFSDGGYYDVESYDAPVSVAIDGTDYSRPATFLPDDTGNYWRMSPDDGLVDALRRGSVATFENRMTNEAFRFRLRGSSAAIAQVLDACRDVPPAPAAALAEPIEADRLTRTVLETRIEAACTGPYSGDAIVELDIGDDDLPDYLLDWDKVACDSAAVGRGGGACGVQMCTIDVYASSVFEPGSWPQPILAAGYDLAEPGEDHVMQTTVSGGSCPITHRCTRDWGWTGSKLEVVAQSDVDVSGNAGNSEGPGDEASSAVAEPASPDDQPNAAQEPATGPVGQATSSEGANPWAALGIVPGQWNSQVPENAMGFVIAMHPNLDGTSVILSCAPDWGLQIGVGAPELDYSNPDFDENDGVYLRLGDALFPTRFHEDKANDGDPSFYMAGRWDGQVRLLNLLNSGADVEIVLHPDGNAAAERIVFTIPGSANDPGYAHVHEVCGDGPRATGAVESFPGVFGDGQSGAWVLRNRTENFVVPVARTIDTRNGAAFGLHCSNDGVPTMHLSPYLIKDGSTQEITLRADGRDFMITAYGDRQTLSFPWDEALSQAMQSEGAVTHVAGLDGVEDNIFPTAGMAGAMDFSYAGCR